LVEGLGMADNIGVEFDLDDLMQMDTSTQFDVIQKTKGTLTLNESRKRAKLGPVEGGDTIYLQQQDHSLAAIAARDEQMIDLVQNPPAPAPEPEADPAEAERAFYEGMRAA
jgi:hypothetical protein